MNTVIIFIYVIIGMITVVFITAAVIDIANTRKYKNYKKYVESIQIGDTFGHNCFKFSDIDDPFSENYDTLGFDPQYYATILDIKKNHKGKTWVKWCFTRNINKDHCKWTDEINDFLRCRTRISRRIDNINTEE